MYVRLESYLLVVCRSNDMSYVPIESDLVQFISNRGI